MRRRVVAKAELSFRDLGDGRVEVVVGIDDPRVRVSAATVLDVPARDELFAVLQKARAKSRKRTKVSGR